MTPLALYALAGCLAVTPGSDHITVQDLAGSFPALALAAPETVIGLAPVPGVQRTFRGSELQRLASRFDVTAIAPAELCFERRVSPVDPARLLQAMQMELPQARIEILDYSHISIPEGSMEFPLAGLREAPGGGFWNGAVLYAPSRRFRIWAKVRVAVPSTFVVAAQSLKAGAPIDALQLRIVNGEVFPSSAHLAVSVEQVAGRVLRRPVPAGTPIRLDWLDAVKDIARGEPVRVDVWNGGAHLEFEAQAEASGSKGQMIPLRNPSSKKRFFARIEGRGSASVGKEKR